MIPIGAERSEEDKKAVEEYLAEKKSREVIQCIDGKYYIIKPVVDRNGDIDEDIIEIEKGHYLEKGNVTIQLNPNMDLDRMFTIAMCLKSGYVLKFNKNYKNGI